VVGPKAARLSEITQMLELRGTLPSNVEMPKPNLFYLHSSTAELTKLPPPVQFHFQVAGHKSHEGWLKILFMSCLPHLVTAESKQGSALVSDPITIGGSTVVFLWSYNFALLGGFSLF